MKKAIFKIACIVLLLQTTSCIYWNNEGDDGPDILPEGLYTAVTMTRDLFESSTVLLPPKNIQNSGKIYVKNDYLFINEPNEGFHIYDNSDPSSPVNIAFLKVLGSSDLSIKGDVLYMNNLTDLIAVKIDFSTSDVIITKRVINTFPEMISPDYYSSHDTAEDEVIIDWILNE